MIGVKVYVSKSDQLIHLAINSPSSSVDVSLSKEQVSDLIHLLRDTVLDYDARIASVTTDVQTTDTPRSVALIGDYRKSIYAALERHDVELANIRLDYERRIKIARTLRVDWRCGVVLCALDKKCQLTTKYQMDDDSRFFVNEKERESKFRWKLEKLLNRLEADDLVEIITIARGSYWDNEQYIITDYGREIVAAMSADRIVGLHSHLGTATTSDDFDNEMEIK